MDDFIEVAGGSPDQNPPLLPSPKIKNSSPRKKGLFLGFFLILLIVSGVLGVISVQKGGFNILKKAQEADPCTDPKPTPAAWPNYGNFSVDKTEVSVGENITVSNITNLSNVTKCKVGYRVNSSGSWTIPSGGGIKDCSSSFTFSFPSAGDYFVIVAAYNDDCSFSCSTENYYSHGECGNIDPKCVLSSGPCHHSPVKITVKELEPTVAVTPESTPTPVLVCPTITQVDCSAVNPTTSLIDPNRRLVKWSSSLPSGYVRYSVKNGSSGRGDTQGLGLNIAENCGVTASYNVSVQRISDNENKNCSQNFPSICTCPTGTVSPAPTLAERCGNAECEPEENCTNCPTDCGPCVSPTDIPGVAVCTNLTAEVNGVPVTSTTKLKIGDKITFSVFLSKSLSEIGVKGVALRINNGVNSEIFSYGSAIVGTQGGNYYGGNSPGEAIRWTYEYTITKFGSYSAQAFVNTGDVWK